MSRLPPPPLPANSGPGQGGPLAQPPGDFAPAGYPPPPSPPGFAHSAPPSPYAQGAPPSPYADAANYAPKLRIRKTPEMLGFRAVDTIGTIVAALFATWIPLAIYSVFLELDRRRLVHEYGAKIPFELENPLNNRLDLVHGFAVVLALIVVPLFLIWFARAYGNLPTISPGKTQSRTAVATVMWIIPIAQFIRPFGYLKELWSRTDRIDKKKPAAPTLIVAYWLSYLAQQILQVLIVVGLVRGEKNPDDLRFAADLSVLWSGVAVVSSTLLCIIVWVVTRRMTTRCAEVTNAVMNAPQHA